ncbi:MAG: thiamine phosphate synthase [Candidatus Fermentibacteraceae bacterium]|nr:thiamine phosphate synthase [Candidatus Fermentibacteraceae bacterium]
MVDPKKLRLYLVTDPVLCGPRGVVETCRLALLAGVGTVQLRDKAASTRELLDTAGLLSGLCMEAGALFIVNDRVDVAMAAGADGVHLGQDDMPVRNARKLLGKDAVIGVSVRTAGEARSAFLEGADYLAANLVFATDTKTDLGEPLGLEGVREIKSAAPLPLVAIGGIKPSNSGDVLRWGADGIAVVSAVMAAEDVGGAVAELLDRMAEIPGG